tara:strand:- start:292 stop:429 length:138 start_codon:yes stop_codon:yes gene_type:complete
LKRYLFASREFAKIEIIAPLIGSTEKSKTEAIIEKPAKHKEAIIQ